MNRFNLIKITYISIITLIGFSACGKKDNTPAPNSTTTIITTSNDTAQYIKWPSNADVYFVGTVSNPFPQNGPIPTLWKNGITTTLSTDISIPMGIAVNNNDVYIVGATTAGSGAVAIYSKNGMITRLASSAVTSSANAITIVGSDVYITGIVDGKATVWKNGVATTITTASTAASEATSIFVNGSDVYLAGNIYNTLTPQAYVNAGLWKNGQLINLDVSGGQSGSFTKGVYVKGNDVYAVGGILGKGATLWKNGVPTILSQDGSTSTSQATGLSITGNDIYVSGYVNGKVTLWKNGVAQTLPYDSNSSIQPQILIGFNNSDIYLAAGYDSKSSTNTLLWLNGTGYKFSNKLCQINGMNIVSH